jgi:hypothetical protein
VPEEVNHQRHKMKAAVTFIILLGFAIQYVSAQKYFLKQMEDHSSGSCIAYEVVDSNQKRVKFTSEITNALKCPSVIGLKDDILITYSKNNLLWYNINTGRKMILEQPYKNVDGIGNPCWSPDGTMVMFAIIDQEKRNGFTEFCRLLIFETDNTGKMIRKQEFDRPVNFTCGSICFAQPGLDYRFKDNRTIEYLRHTLIEDRPGEWETIELK